MASRAAQRPASFPTGLRADALHADLLRHSLARLDDFTTQELAIVNLSRRFFCCSGDGTLRGKVGKALSQNMDIQTCCSMRNLPI